MNGHRGTAQQHPDVHAVLRNEEGFSQTNQLSSAKQCWANWLPVQYFLSHIWLRIGNLPPIDGSEIAISTMF
jgi:hypothetical protein